MNPPLSKIHKPKAKNRSYPNYSDHSSEGFTLLEAMVSLLVLLAMMAGLLPVFMSWRLATIRNSIKTGAIAISQQVLDELRQDTKVGTWPNSGTVSSMPSGDAIITKQGDYTYNTSLTYCADTSYCDTNTRHVTLQISHNNDAIYTIETVYTSFE